MTSNQIALIQSASDSVLIDRLFTLVRSGAAGDEFDVIDTEVYERFARSYGQPTDEMVREDHLLAA
ncbi:hypothetical protein [Marilutibacter chinensis]|uniref:Uncharacterized protein n=1 Tax=Marilutibacter chinensis TaxID=2912247 RepID=A0ABS9HQX6_9GAMM|nr:hypothetical protein [Lysobacter chinensis]MCF7220639.1 hypothetical protein [Lysobacter chinensis]